MKNTTATLASFLISSAFAAQFDAALTPGETWRRADEVRSDGWPYAPFSTRGRDIVNTRNETVVWAGVNWPLSAETMIPEGLEWSSVDDILDLVKSAGFNMLRMGYAIEMVDQIYERNGTDVSLELSLISAMGYENGTRTARAMVSRNPSWTLQTTRFEIWSDVARRALARGILITPDVHVSKAQWCCSNVDGNGWFDSFNFPADQWRRGLAYVAAWAAGHPNVASMSLRNELRPSYNVSEMADVGLQYTWENLVGNMTRAADAVHAANPDVLILWSGMQFDEDLSALTTGRNLLTHPCHHCDAIRDARLRDPVYFDLAAHAWADKLVWELHMYALSETVPTEDCALTREALYYGGFNALGADELPAPPACAATGGRCAPAVRQTPVVLSEFGTNQDALLFTDPLMTCLRDFTVEHGVPWTMWALAGSYRVREGAQFVADTWSLTNFNWTGWGYEEGVTDFWMPWVKDMGVYTI
ncbi:glycoside hydrolase [Xylariomycetidae sp. FL2044]|nr:glycoside hydrolase [Xylariomycetidae sp. FL2044]